MRTAKHRRRGVAIVELTLLLPFMLLMMFGLWEVGRSIQIKTYLANAAREGARVAAQAKLVNKNYTYTEIHKATGNPSVTSVVKNYLQGQGINVTNVTVDFKFLDGVATREPYEGKKGERFEVTVTIPYADVRWTTLSVVNMTNISSKVTWTLMVDDPFSIDTTIPGWDPPALK